MVNERANNTINITKTTKDRLLALKAYSRETLDDIISRMLNKLDYN